MLESAENQFARDWLDAPHLPHGWETGYLFEERTETLLCGDLFTRPGAEHAPVTAGDILGPSEAMRAQMDYFAHAPTTGALIRKPAATRRVPAPVASSEPVCAQH